MLRIARDIPRTVRYDRITGDFEVVVDGQFIGYTRTYLAGETLADETVYDWLRHGLIGDKPAGFRRVYSLSRRYCDFVHGLDGIQIRQYRKRQALKR